MVRLILKMGCVRLVFLRVCKIWILLKRINLFQDFAIVVIVIKLEYRSSCRFVRDVFKIFSFREVRMLRDRDRLFLGTGANSVKLKNIGKKLVMKEYAMLVCFLKISTMRRSQLTKHQK